MALWMWWVAQQLQMENVKRGQWTSDPDSFGGTLLTSPGSGQTSDAKQALSSGAHIRDVQLAMPDDCWPSEGCLIECCGDSEIN
jgi:hypothetical protein